MTDLPGPLADRLSTIDEEHGWIEGTLGPPPDGDGWLSAENLATSPAAVERLYDVARASTGPADDRTVGAMMVQRVAEPGRLAGILYRRDRLVPTLPPGTAFRPYTEERHSVITLVEPSFACLPDDPAATDPSASVVPDLDALRVILVREVEQCIAPAVDPIAERSHLSRRAVWALAGYGSLVSIAETMAVEGDPAEAVAELDALMAVDSPLADPPAQAHLESTSTGLRFVLRMAACCRIYRWPGGREKCSACPLRTPEQRAELQGRDDVDD